MHKINKYIYLGGEFDYIVLDNNKGFEFIDATTKDIMLTLRHMFNFSGILAINIFNELPIMPFISVGFTMGKLGYVVDEHNMDRQANKWVFGAKIGAGLNIKITDNLIFRPEYIAHIMHANYNSVVDTDAQITGVRSGYKHSSVHSNLFINSVRFSLFYRFTI